MNKKGFSNILFFVAIAVLLSIAGYLFFTQKTPTTPSTGKLLEVCPDEWYDNQMPKIIETGNSRPPTQYFIYKGERRELVEFDLSWVATNCSIKPSVVY